MTVFIFITTNIWSSRNVDEHVRVRATFCLEDGKAEEKEVCHRHEDMERKLEYYNTPPSPEKA